MQPPTQKPKLPRSLSHPIGFEALAAALATAPQFDEIELSFRGAWSAWTRSRISSNQPYPILIADFRKWDKRLGVNVAGERLARGAWALHVEPVRRELKSIARAALLSTGLPGLAAWFSAARPPSWYFGRKRCDVIFDPVSGEVRVESVDEKP